MAAAGGGDGLRILTQLHLGEPNISRYGGKREKFGNVGYDPGMKIRTLSAIALAAALIEGASAQQPAQPTGQPAARSEACRATSEQEIAALFDRWNASLQTGDPAKVAANYAAKSILLPTVSNKARLTAAEKEEYFHHFLENKPSGKIDMRMIEIGCNTAVDAGLYTFTFAKNGAVVSARYTYTYRWNGSEWLITSHHSSAMPEK